MINRFKLRKCVRSIFVNHKIKDLNPITARTDISITINSNLNQLITRHQLTTFSSKRISITRHHCSGAITTKINVNLTRNTFWTIIQAGLINRRNTRRNKHRNIIIANRKTKASRVRITITISDHVRKCISTFNAAFRRVGVFTLRINNKHTKLTFNRRITSRINRVIRAIQRNLRHRISINIRSNFVIGKNVTCNGFTFSRLRTIINGNRQTILNIKCQTTDICIPVFIRSDKIESNPNTITSWLTIPWMINSSKLRINSFSCIIHRNRKYSTTTGNTNVSIICCCHIHKLTTRGQILILTSNFKSCKELARWRNSSINGSTILTKINIQITINNQRTISKILLWNAPSSTTQYRPIIINTDRHRNNRLISIEISHSHTKIQLNTVIRICTIGMIQSFKLCELISTIISDLKFENLHTIAARTNIRITINADSHFFIAWQQRITRWSTKRERPIARRLIRIGFWRTIQAKVDIKLARNTIISIKISFINRRNRTIGNFRHTINAQRQKCRCRVCVTITILNRVLKLVCSLNITKWRISIFTRRINRQSTKLTHNRCRLTRRNRKILPIKTNSNHRITIHILTDCIIIRDITSDNFIWIRCLTTIIIGNRCIIQNANIDRRILTRSVRPNSINTKGQGNHIIRIIPIRVIQCTDQNKIIIQRIRINRHSENCFTIRCTHIAVTNLRHNNGNTIRCQSSIGHWSRRIKVSVRRNLSTIGTKINIDHTRCRCRAINIRLINRSIRNFHGQTIIIPTDRNVRHRHITISIRRRNTKSHLNTVIRIIRITVIKRLKRRKFIRPVIIDRQCKDIRTISTRTNIRITINSNGNSLALRRKLAIQQRATNGKRIRALRNKWILRSRTINTKINIQLTTNSLCWIEIRLINQRNWAINNNRNTINTNW